MQYDPPPYPPKWKADLGMLMDLLKVSLNYSQPTYLINNVYMKVAVL